MPSDRNRLLQRDELHLVDPAIRPIVEAAWANGEDVPFGVTYVTVRELTEHEQQHALEIARELEAQGR